MSFDYHRGKTFKKCFDFYSAVMVAVLNVEGRIESPITQVFPKL